MIIIGLTGSIGMGKSTVAGMFYERGVPIHDADRAVHNAMAPGGPAVQDIAEAFPDAVDILNGKTVINRQKLGATVFGNTDKINRLEGILHPYARASADRFVKECREKGHQCALLDIPLLFETGAESRVDVTICVSAAADVQKARVLKRPGMTEDKLDHILARQMPDAEKRRRADFIIHTDTSLSETTAQVDDILEKIYRLTPS